MKLKQSETQLEAKWLKSTGKAVVEDSVAKRIRWLVEEHLAKVTVDSSGWDVLFKDPEDGRYWELTYPESELHGGGPPKLSCLSAGEAKEKYKIP